MNDFSDPNIEQICLQWATQTGKTESILYNCIAYAIDQDPAPSLLVMPSELLGRFVSKNRIQPMVEACERLKEKKDSDPDNFTTLEMKFKNMVLSIAGANSPSNLSARPVRYLFRDEVNKYPPYIGKEADPMSLAKERTKNFWNRKILDVSTPTTEDGNISKELSTSDVIYDYYVPCPHCAHYQKLAFEQIKWPEGAGADEVRHVAWYECEKCNQQIGNLQKPQMLLDGQWRPREQKSMVVRKVGYHLPAWYSPWLTWGDCASEFLNSKDYPEKLMNFRNSWEAEPWLERYDPKTIAEILVNVVDIPPLTVPKDTLALTCGIDAGQGGFWYSVLGWKRDMSPHLIHYGFLVGWDALTSLIWETSYQIEGSEKEFMQIWRAGIDTGGSKYESEDMTMTEACYQWLRDDGHGKVVGTKGASVYSGKKMRQTVIDKMPDGKPIPGGIALWMLDTGAFKDAIHYRLKLDEGAAGRFTFHNETGKDFVSQILAEEKRKDRKGNAEWVRIAKNNHYLDCVVIAFSLADPECNGGIRIFRPPTKTQQSSAEVRKTGGWVKGWRR